MTHTRGSHKWAKMAVTEKGHVCLGLMRKWPIFRFKMGHFSLRTNTWSRAFENVRMDYFPF